jgi:hypothetical protein
VKKIKKIHYENIYFFNLDADFGSGRSDLLSISVSVVLYLKHYVIFETNIQLLVRAFFFVNQVQINYFRPFFI